MSLRLKRFLLFGLLIGMFTSAACLVTTRPGRSQKGVHKHDERPDHQKHKKQKKQKKHKKHH